MVKRTILSKSLMIAFGSTTLCGGVAFAQQTPTPAPTELQRVEITGSSIKRVESEGALPVTIITRDQIAKSGATSVTELMQNLPSMQGFYSQSQSVNGGGGGLTSVSLHSVGSRYTLVLLNGRRMAPQISSTEGARVNLESIPIGAIERVEVLTDGASALYGADAIAGVVNFITRRDRKDGAIELNANKPQHPGASNYSFSITKGFGDLESDKFNLLFSVSLDKQSQLNASQRDFANSGFKPFTTLPDGRTLGLFLSSSNSVPGNVLLTKPDGSDLAAFYSPYYYNNGNTCPTLHVSRGGGYGQQICRFDFAGQVQLIPESQRTGLFGSGRVKINDSWQLFSELALSRYWNEPRFAPPAQPGLFLTPALYNRHVVPFLQQFGLTAADFAPLGDPNGLGPSMNVRVFDAGGRQDRYTTDARHLVLGAEGSAAGWDVNAAVTLSDTKNTDEALSGYLSSNFFFARINDGTYDPLAQGSGQSAGVLAPGVLRQVLDVTKTTLNTVSLKGSRVLSQSSAGDIAVGLGMELSKERLTDEPSAILMGKNALQPTYTDSIIGGGGGALPFDSSRRAQGAFMELVVPVIKNLEFTGALRYDNFSTISNAKGFDAQGNPIGAVDQGKGSSATTYKLSMRFQPSRDLLLRGSYGTGFKAPSLIDVANPLSAGGVTTGSYDCPIPVAVSPALAGKCRPPNSQYNVLQGGNASTSDDALKPEKSMQWTLGMRFEPSDSISIGVDLWNVLLKNRILNIPEQVAFLDAASYLALFTVAPDPVTTQPQLTFIQKPLNLGKARYQGLDVDLTNRFATPVGRLTTKVATTYIIKSEYEIPGLPEYQSSLGKYGPDNKVVFRWLASLSGSLESGDFTHTVNVNLKPGYQDSVATVNADGTVRTGPELRIYNPVTGTWGARIPAKGGDPYVRRVSFYSLIDWQTRYAVSKALSVTVGIKNLADRKAPFRP